MTAPFTITTTIVTTVNPDGTTEDTIMRHDIDVTGEGVPEEFPIHLRYGTAQAACEFAVEALAEFGIGVMGEVVEEPEPDRTRCPVGNLLRYHRDGPCDATCDVASIIEGKVLV